MKKPIKPLKVIQLIDSLSPGGAEMMAVNIANALAENNVESHLCATRQEGDLKSKIGAGVGYVFLDKKSTLDFKAIQKLIRYLKSNEINTIHAHATSYFTAFLVKLQLPKITLVWHDHYGNSENLKERKKFPLTLVSKTFKTVITVNNHLLQWAKQHLQAKHCHYLPNFATFGSENPAITQLHGENEKRIVCLANLRPQKDHINLLKAFKMVREKHADWTLHLVGMDFKDVYAEEIRATIKQLHLKSCVFLYGSCPDTQHILKQATIGVLSSKSEGLPVALLEYGLAKLPVAVTDVGECGVVVSHGKSGMLLPPSEENALAEALIFLIENEDRRKEFGENLDNNIRLNFSAHAFITQLIAIYQLE
ncbi:MAG TPA: glycosyltransferase family 4 protein [Lutibacter sp.]|nr:glycosyltransferase family 4 protein [Lutibacter sp.]